MPDHRDAAFLYQLAKDRIGKDGLGGVLRSVPTWLYNQTGAALREQLLLASVTDRILERENLKRRCSTTGDIWFYGTEEEFTIDHPRPSELPEEMRRRLGTYANERPFVCEIPNAKLVGPQPIGLTEDNEVILETTLAHRRFLYLKLEKLVDGLDTPRALRMIQREVRNADSRTSREFDVVFPLVRWPYSYYHWTVEYLPKLRAWERYREATGVTPTVLIQPDPPSWIRDTLELAGCGPENWVEWEGGSALARKLVVGTHRSRVFATPGGTGPNDFNPSPDDCRWLRERMRSNLPEVDTDQFSSRIYISRENADLRRLSNRDAVLEMLESLGFESYVLEEMPLDEQVALFSEAEIIVGPHGAGFVNMIYSNDVSVVDLVPDKMIEPYFFCLARQLGFDYEALVCECGGANLAYDAEYVTADVDKLRDIVEKKLSTRPLQQ